MAQEPVYNLLQAIDPSKIKVPISEKFSKLTLSSNKKRREQEVDLLHDDQHQKRDSASRNLLQQLSQTQTSVDASLFLPVQRVTNPLLRSDSSKDETPQRQKSHLGEYYETTMESLNVTTQDASDLSLDLDFLSQKISALSVVCHQRNSPTSSTTADPLTELTQLISTESQRSSIGEMKRFHNIKEVPVKILRSEIVDGPSSPASSAPNDLIYEITDDEEVNENEDTLLTEEEDEEDTEDEVITISDSSVSLPSYDQTEMAVSTGQTVQNVGETTMMDLREHLQLPLPKLSPEKIERLEAFLKDVSMEQRYRAEIGCTSTEDSICMQCLPADRLITADTESMPPEDDEQKITPKAIGEHQSRLNASQGKIVAEDEITKTPTAKQLAEAVTQDHSIVNVSKTHDVTPQNRERRLESADTVENTISDLELDSSLLLQVTPTPRRPTDSGKRFIYEDGNESSQLPQMTGLQTKSPQIPQKMAQPSNGCEHQNIIVHPNIEVSNDVRRLASAETEPNTILTDPNLTDHDRQYTTLFSTANLENIRKFACSESEDNRLAVSKHPNSPKSEKRSERRLASADTEDVTASDLHLSNLTTSESYDDNERRLALDDTEGNTHLELPLTPVNTHSEHESLSLSSSPEKNSLSGSVYSIVSSSDQDQCNGNVPIHSITILETDEEECIKSHSSQSTSPQPHDNNKLSSSLHGNEDNDDSESHSSMSELQMSMANINISAKINIKITIPHSAETSDDEESSGPSSRQNRNTNSLPENRQSLKSIGHGKEINELQIQGRKNEEIAHYNTNVIEKETGHIDIVEIISDSDKSNYEDEHFVGTAAKLLTELYGNSWQTPEVLRNLVKSKESGDNKNIGTTPKASKRQEKGRALGAGTAKAVEESVLGDFSLFRRNIHKTNSMDSTRIKTPNEKLLKKGTSVHECRTEPRNIRKCPENDSMFAVPITKSHRKPVRTPIVKISAEQIRSQKERWPQLVDNDSGSECNNASDDDDADKSDESWKGSSSLESSDSSDSDYEISTNKSKETKRRPTAKSTNKTKVQNESQKKSDSNNDDLVYLDLSKAEVEVQEEVPVSPPANHDATFASKLEEILKTCRREDKPKLPSSAQSTKSKRKLFTPMFGQDFEDVLTLAPEIEKKENRQITENTNGEDGLIVDDALTPFDATGKPKKLELFNKPLEAVKGGMPVFPITTSAKKNGTPTRRALQENNNDSTPISKSRNEPRTKTPAQKETVETASGEISKTPDYKYSFLKSLDVTVSNSFCHPEARVYRDNYRTKKEDLSRILYNLYNDRLFKNKLEVQITWNKKLQNTAGRCLNKKKLGIRSSVIELSEKVLTSADRLRCTLIHELCHAATWIFNGEGGHGKTWKDWAHRANATFPELPKIGVCHQYEIEYKYTYKCTLCAAKSHAHSKSKKVENIRCSYCHGAIEIFLNKKDKKGNIVATPIREPTGFAKFVKDNYKKFKRDELKHADVMKLLSSEFAAIKLAK